jgi:hypothetical protein
MALSLIKLSCQLSYQRYGTRSDVGRAIVSGDGRAVTGRRAESAGRAAGRGISRVAVISSPASASAWIVAGSQAARRRRPSACARAWSAVVVPVACRGRRSRSEQASSIRSTRAARSGAAASRPRCAGGRVRRGRRSARRLPSHRPQYAAPVGERRNVRDRIPGRDDQVEDRCERRPPSALPHNARGRTTGSPRRASRDGRRGPRPRRRGRAPP